MKKKYFVLRGESNEASARLEYYDSDKKYRSGQNPKRTISLKTCFNINRRTDTKHKHVIALYTKDDVFCVVLDSDKQQEEWLRLLLRLQSGEDYVDGEPLRPIFEHIWKVKLQDKGLGDSKNLVGPYYVCLSNKTLTLVKCNAEDKQETLEFPLTQIRTCGGTESFFYIEVGRQSVTGAGELWMLTEDANIAKNMSSVIQSAFNHHQDPHRRRSASATEANRPIGLHHRKNPLISGKSMMASCPYSGSYGMSEDGEYASTIAPKFCITCPPPMDNRLDHAVPVMSSLHSRAPFLPVPRPASQRRHSVSAVSSSSGLGHQPSVLQQRAAVSQDVPDGPAPPTLCTTVSHQRTKSCPVSDTSSVPVIVEPQRVLSQSQVGVPCPLDCERRGSGGSSLRRPMPSKSSTGTRERSDSMPSRNRTTSEGTHRVHVRPQSVHDRGVSYSPPGPCSTDSAGSSLSIDETDFERFPHGATPDEKTILEENVEDAHLWPNDPDLDAERMDVYVPMPRPPASLSLPIHTGQRKISAPGVLQGSPCGSSPSDYLPMSPIDSNRRVRPGSSPSTSDYLPMSPGEFSSRRPGTSPSISDYISMSPRDLSRRGTIATSPSNSDYMAMSPADSKRIVGPGTSPSTSDYLPMSPPGDIARRPQSSSMDYLPMSPADIHRGHSRGSSLTEDGYVPMAPAAHSDDGYVDMDPVSVHRLVRDDHHSDMSPGSSCSVTSGTPSTDHFCLEKVSSYFTPSEEEEGSLADRPTRACSFGSKGRVDVIHAAETARVRAFSVGTRPRQETHKLLLRAIPPGSKFSSAPLLSSSWSGSARYHAHDPMADLMEIDFTKKGRSRLKGVSMIECAAAQANSSADSGYMDMSSKSPPKPPSSKHLFSPPECKSVGVRLNKPSIVSASALKPIGEKPDIKPQMFPNSSSANLSILPNKHHAPYVEMRGRISRSGSESKADAYSDLCPNNVSKLLRKSSVDSVSDYMPMSGGNCSQPINIRSPSSPGATSRKSSSTTPTKPPGTLLLNSTGSFNSPVSSVKRSQKRKPKKRQERRGSKENVTTPTAIFPLSLNSPLSPKKVYPTDRETVTPLTMETAIEMDSSNLAVPLDRVLRICSKENSPVGGDVTKLPPEEGDYAVMRPGPPSKWTGAAKVSEELQSRLSSTGCSLPNPRSSEKLTELEVTVRSAPLAKPENSRLKPSGEPHAGVSRQVSTSSSSSTEVMSVKEGAERDITYASLDLGSESEEPRSPRPSPAPVSSPGPFPYAEIDFQKSESLRAPQSSNKKIRH